MHNEACDEKYLSIPSLQRLHFRRFEMEVMSVNRCNYLSTLGLKLNFYLRQYKAVPYMIWTGITRDIHTFHFAIWVTIPDCIIWYIIHTSSVTI